MSLNLRVSFAIFCFCIIGANTSIMFAAENDSTSNTPIKNFKFLPYIAPSYSPELQLLVTAGGVATFNLQPGNLDLGRSNVPFSIGYSSNHSFTISMLPYLYFKDDKYRIATEFYLRDMPDNYWGVGYDQGNRVSQKDETTAYNRFWWSIAGSVVRKVSDGVFVGLSYDVNQTNASNLNEYMQEDPYVVEYGKQIKNVGIGFIVQLDCRDNPQNAYEGYLLSLAVTKYNKLFRVSGNGFAKMTIDARKFYPVGTRRTVALQMKTIYADGSVPWTDMPQLGSMYDLRGYQLGRFRDKTVLFGIAEYRHMFQRKRANRKGSYESPIGFVAWCGAGSLAKTYDKMQDWLLNVGVGLRYEIQPRLNVRVDYGFGLNNSAIYLSINEAF